MCECGCTSNDQKFRLLGPAGTLYIVTLSGHCTNCDAPSGICIEQIDRTHTLYWEYQNGEFGCKPLKFEDWPDSKGVAIATGMRKHEFVKAVAHHLVGIQPNGGLFDDKGYIDDAGAEVVVEEMYEDSQKRPALVVAKQADESSKEVTHTSQDHQ